MTEAFVRNPNLRWTPIGLSEWWGLRIDLVNAIVRELAADRVIDRVPGSGDHYILRAGPERV